MKYSKFNRQVAVALCIVITISMFTGFKNYSGFGSAYYENNIEIFDGVSYTEIIGEHAINGIEHGHIVEAEIDRNGVIPLVYNGIVRGTYTVGAMVDYAESQGYKVLAAINGDIYDTVSGTPKGLVIHDGNIVTSGYNSEKVISFDKNNRASLEIDELIYQANGIIEYKKITEIQREIDVPIEKVTIVTSQAINENGESYIVETEDIETIYEKQLLTEQIEETITESVALNIDFLNVPHGEALGLHLYNSHYSDSTKSNGIYAEVVIETDDVQFGVNKTIKGIVTDVNRETNNTVIKDNTIVLSTVKGSKNYDLVSNLKIGSEIDININNPLNNGLSEAKECIGYYYSVVENGKNVTNGTNINPRSCLGVKRDGSLVMVEIDGRQPNYSRGINLPDLSEMMISLGCEYAFNLDGGGSSVLYVRQPGKDVKATKVSRPSENTERKVANAILLVYKENTSDFVEHVNVYPNYQLMMPGSTVTFNGEFSNPLYEKINYNKSITYYTDIKFGYVDTQGNFTAGVNKGSTYVEAIIDGKRGRNKIDIVDDIIIIPNTKQIICEGGEVRKLEVSAGYGTERVYVPVASSNELFDWSCDSSIGSIDENGVFTASTGTARTGKIYISYNDKTEVIDVQVGASVISFNDTASHWAEEPIGVLAGIGYLNGIGDNLFAPDSELTRSQFIAMLAKITPDREEQIIIERYENQNEVSVIVLPNENENIDDLSLQEDLINPGMESTTIADNNTPTPSGITSNLSETNKMNFTDVNEEDWYYEYVKWGYDNGIISGMGDGTFAPNLPITREQMAVMLCKYSSYIGFILPQIKEIPVFTDQEYISLWAKDYVLTVAGAGIINGFDTGDFKPQGVATRAQAAKVLYEFCQLKGIL